MNYLYWLLCKNSFQNTEFADIKSLEVFGNYDIDNQSKVRKAGAKNLTQSWQSIPHVSHFEEAEITKIEKQRKERPDLHFNNKLSIWKVLNFNS